MSTSLASPPDPLPVAERSFRNDASVMGVAMAVSAALGVAQVLVLPKLLAVETFGAYRIFLLYASYIGVLHAGVADGALLSWAPGPAERVAAEWRRLAPRLLAVQLVALGLAALVSLWLGPPVAVAVRLVFALAVVGNLLTLTQFALQGSRRFRWLAATTVLPPFVFLVTVVALPTHLRSLAFVGAAYIIGQLIACAVGVWRIATAHARAEPAPEVGPLFRTGSSVLVANVAAGLTQSIDRLVLSWAVRAASFAMYAFASSALSIATTAALGLSRAALPHAARSAGAARGAFFDRLQRLLVVAYGAALLGVPAFEWFVARWLPAYRPSLPVFRVLLVGALFWTAIQVVLVVALQAAGHVRVQLRIALLGIVVVGAAAGAAVLAGAPQWGVASAASGALVATWIVAHRATRDAVGEAGPGEAARFAATAAIQSVAMVVTALTIADPALRTLVYALFAAVPTAVAARPLLRAR